MFITGFIVAYLLTVALTSFLAVGIRNRRWSKRLIWFFLVLLLATWASGLWLPAIGPLMMSMPWLSFLLSAAALGLFLTALLIKPRPPARPTLALARSASREPETAVALDIFSWTLIGTFTMAIVIRHLVVV